MEPNTIPASLQRLFLAFYNPNRVNIQHLQPLKPHLTLPSRPKPPPLPSSSPPTPPDPTTSSWFNFDWLFTLPSAFCTVPLLRPPLIEEELVETSSATLPDFEPTWMGVDSVVALIDGGSGKDLLKDLAQYWEGRVDACFAFEVGVDGMASGMIPPSCVHDCHFNADAFTDMIGAVAEDMSGDGLRSMVILDHCNLSISDCKTVGMMRALLNHRQLRLGVVINQLLLSSLTVVARKHVDWVFVGANTDPEYRKQIWMHYGRRMKWEDFTALLDSLKEENLYLVIDNRPSSITTDRFFRYVSHPPSRTPMLGSADFWRLHHHFYKPPPPAESVPIPALVPLRFTFGSTPSSQAFEQSSDLTTSE